MPERKIHEKTPKGPLGSKSHYFHIQWPKPNTVISKNDYWKRDVCNNVHVPVGHLFIYLQKKKKESRTSLVVHWLRIHLPMQRTGVWSLVWEDSTSQGATKPVHHNYWVHTPRTCAGQQEKPLQSEAQALQLESSTLTTTRECLCTARKK